MKVLVIGPSPEKSKGGMATVIKDIRDDKQLNKQFDIEIYESYIDGNKFERAVYMIIAFLNFKKIYSLYDLFHIHVASYGSAFRKAKYISFLKKRGKKVILHIHGAAFMDFYNNLSDSKKDYIVDILNSCDLVIALSDEWKNKFKKHFKLRNCISLPNGISTADFRCAVTEKGEHTNAFLLLGRIGKRKGAYDLVNAVEMLAPKYPDVKLYIAGDGEIEKINDKIIKKKLQRNIKVVGWVDFAGKIELLKKVATVVLPSYNEGLPMSILEGMAAGKAIISSSVGALPEVVKEENGIIIEPGNVNALVSAMEICMTNPMLISDMSLANLQKIEESFSVQKMHKILAECYIQAG